MKKITFDKDLEVEKIADLTTGFSGADLANLINEAALLATRRKAESVNMEDFVQAIERIIAGLEKRNRLLNPKEREIVAYHEMGHAIIELALPGSDPVQKSFYYSKGYRRTWLHIAAAYRRSLPDDKTRIRKEDCRIVWW